MLRALAVAAAVALLPGLAVAGASTASAGRQSLTSDTARGGANVYLHSAHATSRSGSSCTLGFPVKRRNGARGVLTAGHCVAVLPHGAPYDVFETKSGRSNTTYVGEQLGEVPARRYHVGTEGDNALVLLADGRDAKPQIYTGDATSAATAAVIGSRAPKVGMAHLCYSGAVSGEHCGFRIRYRPRTMRFDERSRTLRIHHEWPATGRCTAKAGDSGSPVFLKRGSRVLAVGILSAGGTVNGHCAIFFTSVAMATSSLHVKLLHSS